MVAKKKHIIAISIIILLISSILIISLQVSAADLRAYGNNLIFIATSTKATSGTKFKTVGFTASFTGSSGINYETVIKMEQKKEDDNGDGTVTTTFEIPFVGSGNTIMQRFNDDYGVQDDFITFFRNDNTLFLDPIITILENGVAQGGVNADGTLWGEVYTTLPGILGARNWAESTREDLKDMFGERVDFEGQLIPPTELTPPTARISNNGTEVNDKITFNEEEFISLSGELSSFPSYAQKRYFSWRYRAAGTSSWTTLVSNGLMAVSPNWPVLAPGEYEVQLEVYYDTYTTLKNQKTINVEVIPKPIINRPIHGVDINPKSVKLNEKYQVIDESYALDGKRITKWEVEVKRRPLSTATWTTIMSRQTISNPASFFGSKTQSQEGHYLYTVYKVTDNLGVESFGSASSVFVTVTNSATPAPSPTPTPTPFPGQTPTPTPTAPPYVSPMPTPTPTPVVIPNKDPVAIITGPGSTNAGNSIYISGASSYDPDGSIVSYSWTAPGATGSLSGSGGSIKYTSEGNYSITLTVTDNGGNKDTVVKTINVSPSIPTANIWIGGSTKQNRKVVLDGEDSITPLGTTISSYDWSIIPVSGCTASDIKYIGELTEESEDVLFKKDGTYRVTLTVRNNLGYTDTVSRDIRVSADVPPVAEFTGVQYVLRDPADSNYATIELIDQSYSPDRDVISRRKWTYKYDSDNDGSFLDETSVVLSDANLKSIKLRTNQVGKYLFELEIHETFGQSTISSFVTASDYRFDTTADKPQSEKIVEVDNIAPTTSFQLIPSKKVDVYVFAGDNDAYYTNQNMTQLNQFKADLLNKGFDANYIYLNAADYTQVGIYTEKSFGYKVYKRYEFDFGWNRHSGGDWYMTPDRYTYYVYMLEGGRIVMDGYYYEDEEDYEEGYISRTSSFLIDIEGVTHIVLARSGEYYVRLNTGEFKVISFQFVNYEDDINYTIKDVSASNAAVLNDAFLPGSRIMHMQGGMLYLKYDSSKGYDRLWEMYPDYSTVRTVAKTNYDASNGYYTVFDRRGYVAFHCPSENRTFLANSEYWLPTDSYGYNPTVIKGFNYNSLKSTLPVRGANNYAIFLSNSSSTSSGLYVGLNNTFTDWLNDNGFKVYESVNSGDLNRVYSSIDVPVQTLTLAQLQDVTEFRGLYTYRRLEDILNDIQNSHQTASEETTSYVITGEPYECDYFYEDYESDPVFETKWKYTHDPYYFENSEGLDPDSGKLLDEPKYVFTKPGKYEVIAMSRDNPKNYYKFDSYKKWSDEDRCKAIIYVHRRPIAQFSTHVFNSGGYKVAVTDNSYDLDHISSPNRGITETRWQYKVGDAGAWVDGLPAGSIDYNYYTYIKLEVKDVYGAWSRPKIIPVRGYDVSFIPATITLNPEERSWGSTSVNVNVSCSGSISYVDYKWSASAIKPTDGWSRASGLNFSTTQAAEGQWFLHVNCVYGGLGATYKLSGSYCIDKTKPTGTYTLSTTDWVNNNVIINFTGYDALSGVKRIRMPNGTWVSGKQCSYVAATNGTHNFIVEDNAGNQATVPVVISNIDKTDPSGIFTANSSSWTKNIIKVTFNPSDTGGSGVKQWRYRRSSDNGVTWGSWSSYTIGDVNGTITINTDGIYKLQAEVIDNAGNVGIVTSGTYSRDTILPNAIFLPNKHNWTNKGITVMFEPLDIGGSGVYRSRYRISSNNGVNYGAWSAYTSGDITKNILLTDEGVWKIQVEVEDNAGNTATVTSGAYKIDKTAPSGSFTPAGCDWTNVNVTVAFDSSDSGGSNVRQWRYRKSGDNGYSWSNWSLYIPSGSHKNIILNNTGVWRIQVEVVDNAGNISTINSNAFLIDKNTPSYTSTSITGQSYRNGNYYWIKPNETLNIKIRGYDQDSGMRYSYIRLYSTEDNRAVHDWTLDSTNHNEWMTSSYTDIIGAVESYEGSGYYEVNWKVKGLADVLSDIQYCFTDIAGNEVGYDNTGCYIGVDGIAPGLPNIIPDHIEWTNSDVVVAIIHGIDTGSGAKSSQYRIGGSSWLDYNSKFTILDEGKTHIFARTIDNVGNIGEEALHSVKIDKTPPVISVTPETNSVVGFSLPVEVKITDEGGSGFKNFRYAWSNSITKPLNGWQTIYNEISLLSLTEAGSLYLHIEAIDTAGNIAYACYGTYTLFSPEVKINFDVVNRNDYSLPTIAAGGEYSILSCPDTLCGAVIESNVEIIKAEAIFSGDNVGELTLGAPLFDGHQYTYTCDIFSDTISPSQPDGLCEVTIVAKTLLDTIKSESRIVSILTEAYLNVEIYNDAEQMIYTDTTSVETEYGTFNAVLSQYSENIIIARTSPYVCGVVAEFLDETGQAIHIVNLSTNNNDAKWEWATCITEPFFGGINFGVVRLTATTTNGNTQSKEMTYFIRRIKLDNLRINDISDYNWKEYFIRSNGEPSELARNGINTSSMPVFKNHEYMGIKLGYMIKFKIDSIGLYRNEDSLSVDVTYYVMDNSNNIFEADIYVRNEDGVFALLENSEYNKVAGSIILNSSSRSFHEEKPEKETFNTWEFEFFLPSTAKVVKKGESLDIYKDNSCKNKLLIVFDITGHSKTGSTYDYTIRENLWGAGDGSEYGANLPSQKDLLQKGLNKGEVFWYNLNETALDDLEFYREW